MDSLRLWKIDKLRLVDEVKKRPELWKTDNRSNNKSHSVMSLWKEVAASFGSDVTDKNCKYKWNKLRKNYTGTLNRTRKRIARAKKEGTYDPTVGYDSKMVWFKNMSFIRQTLNPHKNYCYSDHEGSQSSSKTHDTKVDLDTETKSELHSRDEGHMIKRNIKAGKLQEVQVNVLTQPSDTENFDNKISDIKPSNDINYAGDYDYIFLVSCLEHMKMMNKLQNLEIRAKITDLILNIRFSSTSESSDEIPNLEDLQKNEDVLQTKTLKIRRFNELIYAADYDYHFLVSCLPHMKVMSQLQNIQFRAKTNNLFLKILSGQAEYGP